jgi:hypothetical protein
MQLSEILIILENRLYNLIESRKQAVNSGGFDTVNQIDSDIASTSISVEQIKQTLETNQPLE